MRVGAACDRGPVPEAHALECMHTSVLRDSSVAGKTGLGAGGEYAHGLGRGDARACTVRYQ